MEDEKKIFDRSLRVEHLNRAWEYLNSGSPDNVINALITISAHLREAREGETEYEESIDVVDDPPEVVLFYTLTLELFRDHFGMEEGEGLSKLVRKEEQSRMKALLADEQYSRIIGELTPLYESAIESIKLKA
jgi:hypothetical protein